MKTILLLCLFLSALFVQAGVVFEQPHDGSGTLHHSSRYQANGTDYDHFVTLNASAANGYRFTGWTENGIPVSGSADFSFTCSANRTLVAHFVPILGILPGAPGEIQLSWPASAAGWTLEESPDPSIGSWSPSSRIVTIAGGTHQVAIPTTGGSRFFHLREP